LFSTIRLKPPYFSAIALKDWREEGDRHTTAPKLRQAMTQLQDRALDH